MEFIRLHDLTRRIGVSKATVWRWVKAGTFPKPTKFGPHTTVWSVNEVDAWTRARLSERDAKAA